MSTYRASTLPNGMRVASESLPGVKSVAVTVTTSVGARHEEAHQGGISHVLEHMAFKGTEKRSAQQIAEEFDAVGGHFNAYTSLEYTVYHAKVIGTDLQLALDIISDILLNSTYKQDELERERGVILQEIAMHHDTPDDLIFDVFDAQAFPNQPLGRPILGTPELVSGYQREDILGYMQHHYTPDRMVLSVAGDVDHDALMKMAGALFTQPKRTTTFEEVKGQYGGGQSIQQRSELEQLQLMLGFESLTLHDEDYYALQLFSSILGGGMSSRLFQEIREKRGLVYHVGTIVSAYQDCGLLCVYAATGEAESAELPLLIAEEILKMTDKVSEKELMRVKNQHRAEMMMIRENPASVANWIGKHLMVYGKYRQMEELVARIDAVTLEDVRRMAEKTLACKNPTLAALGPASKLCTYDKLQQRLAA